MSIDNVYDFLPPEIDPKTTPIKIVNIDELLIHVFPVREAVLGPVFVLGSINMIFSGRGIGKTHMALWAAYAAACGAGFWNWTATRAIKTLVIDGEMPGEALQARLAAIVDAVETEPLPENLKIITIDLNDGQMPDLSNLGGQLEIEDACNEAELIIVDNLSCLARSGKENESESWTSLSQWALRMRSHGKCVIFMHHAGKSGTQRGTSKREDLLDVIIELKHPTDYDSKEGARFTVNFSKARHLTGEDSQPFEAWLKTDSEGKQFWEVKSSTESTYQQILDLVLLGMTQTDIAQELDINKSTVCRHIKNAIEKGDLKEREKVTGKPGKKSYTKRADIDD
ncbi:MAG: AAA family ATPase [Methylococcaceae bacterium]